MNYTKKIQRLIILFSFIFYHGHVLAKDAILNPEPTVKELLSSIEKIKKGNKLSKQQEEINRISSQKALSLIDLKRVSQKTLGKYWNELTINDKNVFVSLLSQVFVKIAFPSSSKFFSNLKIRFLKTEIENDIALVPISVISSDQGEIDIDFSLNLNGENWRIIDVILDGVSMRNNLRSQFKKVIRLKGYAELIKKIKKKINKN